MGRRIKPKVDPLVVAEQRRQEARKPENWGPNSEALTSQADVRTTAGSKGKVSAIRREDVFDRMRPKRTDTDDQRRRRLSDAAFTSVRRLDVDMAERRGEGAQGSGEKVDGGGSRTPLSERMLQAGNRVEGVLKLLFANDSAMLREMLQPHHVISDAAERWRVVVGKVTGETNAPAQAALLRNACENLAEAYKMVDATPRKAA